MRLSTILIATLLIAFAFCACDSAALAQSACPQDCKDIGFTGDGVCVAPTQLICTSQTNTMCNSTTSTKKACITVGYVNDSDFCKTPSFSDCFSIKLTQCQYDQSICVKVYGFEKQSNGICVAPSDCKAAGKKLCAPNQLYCRSQGYSSGPNSEDCICDKYVDQGNTCTTKSSGVLIGISALFLAVLLF